MDLVMLALTVIFPAFEAEVMKDPKILNQVLLGCFAEGWVPEIVKFNNRHCKILSLYLVHSGGSVVRTSKLDQQFRHLWLFVSIPILF